MQETVSKDDWVAMFQEIGLDEKTMKQWHRLFERRHPEGHEAFLKWLGIAPTEISAIRQKSS